MMLYPYSYDYKLTENNAELVSSCGSKYGISLLRFLKSYSWEKNLRTISEGSMIHLIAEAKIVLQIYRESRIG